MSLGVLKVAREGLGISQVRLSALSGVSLPTIQNIEANRANPSWQVLTALAAALGLETQIILAPPDFSALSVCGLPLDAVKGQHTPSSSLLEREVKKLCLWLSDPNQSPSERIREAAHALILAVKQHYPTWYKDHLKASPAVSDVLRVPPTGRVIKLSRIARQTLSEYL